MTSAVPAIRLTVSGSSRIDRAEQDPDDRQQVGDERGAGRAPVGEDREVADVREAGADDPEPHDREDRLGRRLHGGERAVDEERRRDDDEHREEHLEQRRDARREALHVALGVDVADGVGQARAEQQQLAGQVVVAHVHEVRRDEQDHAREPDRKAGDPGPRDALVGQEHRRHDDHEQRHRRVEDRRQRGVDRLLAVRDQDERDDDVDERHDQQVAVLAARAGERLAGEQHDGPQEDGREDEAARDHRQRRQVSRAILIQK